MWRRCAGFIATFSNRSDSSDTLDNAQARLLALKDPASEPPRSGEIEGHQVKVRIDIILTAAAAIVGAAAAWSGYQMGLVQFGKPGAGLFPLLIGVLLALLSALEFLRAWNASVELPLSNAGHHFALSSSIFAALAVYVVVLPFFGFLASSIVLVSFLFYVAGRKRLLLAVAFGIALVLPVYVIFGWALKLQFPQLSIF
jgi:hypothetical protein